MINISSPCYPNQESAISWIEAFMRSKVIDYGQHSITLVDNLECITYQLQGKTVEGQWLDGQATVEWIAINDLEDSTLYYINVEYDCVLTVPSERLDDPHANQ